MCIRDSGRRPRHTAAGQPPCSRRATLTGTPPRGRRAADGRVIFDAYEIRAWYASPYPLDEWEGAGPHTLWVCSGCFKYMQTPGAFLAHQRRCTYTHPPGRKVYERGAHIIWEVDGAGARLYAQNLCLFGKLFIDHKTIFFDVDPFQFYVLTDATSQYDHVLGFFSKERVSYDDYNLACIITFPPYQKRGYGTLLIELSYYLSRTARVTGTPERPLSELGLKGYVSYWTAVVLRTLLAAFCGEDEQAQRIRAVLAGDAASPWPDKERPQPVAKRRRGGWAGELPREAVAPREPAAAPQAPRAPTRISTTLGRVAAAAGLRPEDATLALANARLLAPAPRGAAEEPGFLVRRDAVETAARRCALKPAILEEAYLL